ncbi:hypothetical protein ACYATM_01700 [Lactobacillaceae bacterium Scapto_B20]
MKKIWGALVAVIMIGLFGGFMINNHRVVNNEASAAISHGNQNIQSRQYHNAVVNFKQALDAQPDNVSAKQALEQIQTMQSADQFYQAQHFVTAAQAYQKVIDLKQSSILVQRAKQQLVDAQSLLNGAINLTNTYNQALRLNHVNNYRQSNKVLLVAMNDANLRNQYFKSIATRIKKLHAANSAKQIDSSSVTNRLAIRPQTFGDVSVN